MQLQAFADKSKDMETTKKSFMVYLDSKTQILKLNDTEAGILFKAILDYADTGKSLDAASLSTQAKPEAIDPRVIDFAFEGFKSQIDRDGARYRLICEKRSESARRRYQQSQEETATSDPTAKTSKSMQLQTKASKSMQEHAKAGDRDRDRERDRDKEEEKEKKKNSFSPTHLPNEETALKKFLIWLGKTCPELCKTPMVKKGITEKEFESLIAILPGDPSTTEGTQPLKAVMDAMDNKAWQVKKNTSFYKTAKNWLERDLTPRQP